MPLCGCQSIMASGWWDGDFGSSRVFGKVLQLVPAAAEMCGPCHNVIDASRWFFCIQQLPVQASVEYAMSNARVVHWTRLFKYTFTASHCRGQDDVNSRRPHLHSL
jgi:hypothetical protein